MKILSLASLIFLIFLVGSKGLIAFKVESRAMKIDGKNTHFLEVRLPLTWILGQR